MTQEDESVWEPVGSGDYDNYDLAFVNVNKEEEQLYLNQDGEDIELATNSVEGVYEGHKDISSDGNPPSFNFLVKNHDEETTFAFGELAALKRQFEEIEEGEEIKVEFKGVGENDIGRQFFDFQIYRKSA